MQRLHDNLLWLCYLLDIFSWLGGRMDARYSFGNRTFDFFRENQERLIKFEYLKTTNQCVVETILLE